MIRNRLRELRAERGLTQQDVASRIGVSRQTLNAIEGGKYSPSLEVAFLIAAMLQVALDRVFWFEAE
ncbi:helix-turn-helix transcriptional regulator [Terriglobus aquaticus]|uniref:Helix-turn-helix transcriptional regulator n=1 Tax=Terriglobus aquaticus TaxID=940139 RepID=A0ABW9KI74_9BACT|nr:helix-turn-helix transcriptional regulator [Terriglobus aquaticus]